MRLYIKALAILTFVLAMAPVAKADLLVEPYIGYGLRALSYDLKATPGENTDAGGGVTLGGRLGIAMPLVWFAADYSIVTYSMKNAKSAPGISASDYSADNSALYGVVGIKIPFLQAYAGYGLMDQLTEKRPGGDAKFTGNALKFGVGFTGFPIVSLNLEYQIHTYNKYTPLNGAETDVSAGYNKYNDNVILLSVSAPFRF
jgi:hypothetical protein